MIVRKISLLLFFIFVAGGIGLGGYFGYTRYFSKDSADSYKTPEEADVYVRFDMEAYDKIVLNYWDKVSEDKLSGLFRLSLAKAASTTPESVVLPSNDRAGTAKMLAGAMKGLKGESKKKLALDTVIVALYNLEPAGRSGLMSAAQETDMRNEEKNINPDKDLYQNLGLGKGASTNEINQAFSQKEAELKASTTPQAKQELEQVAYAHKVLSKEETKARYDQTKVEPTVFSRVVGGKTLYLYMDKISPTTLDDFARAIVAASTTPNLDSMIIDLRGNIGGTLDIPQYFLGFYLGINAYAFDLFHQGDYKVQRTAAGKAPELERYSETAIVTDGMTQSTAELITASFKRFKLGHVVGTKTRGWGTVENTFPMETVIDPGEKYTLFLVHSITLRDDGMPIESRGVEPDVDTGKPEWKNSLPRFFRQADIISALSKVVGAPPMK